MSDMRTQEEIDDEIARQDAFEDARSVESGGPSGLTYGGTEIGGGVVEIPEVTKTPAEILAEQNRLRLGEAEKAADRAGGFVTGADQDEVDALLAGVRSGVYSVEDALGRLSNIEAAGRESLSTGGGTGNVDTLDENTFATLKSYLKDFGLESLEGTLTELMARGIEDETSVLFELRNTDVFKTRFKANQVRQAAGLPSLSPRAYIDQENTYREVLRRGGMLEYFNRQDIFESLIGGDVSPQELFDRMTNAYQVVRDANPAVKTQMRTLYNVEDKDLAAFFLDPKSGVDVLKRKAQAAKIAATGLERSGIQLASESAEDIASRGFTDTQASEAFGRIGQQSELYKPIGRGEEEIGEQERIGAAFGYDTDAFNRVERRRAKRIGEFKGGGQFARTTGATSGTTETSIGTAQ
jgi:hypothetical protein